VTDLLDFLLLPAGFAVAGLVLADMLKLPSTVGELFAVLGIGLALLIITR
jgi:hypothetical protein